MIKVLAEREGFEALKLCKPLFHGRIDYYLHLSVLQALPHVTY